MPWILTTVVRTLHVQTHQEVLFVLVTLVTLEMACLVLVGFKKILIVNIRPYSEESIQGQQSHKLIHYINTRRHSTFQAKPFHREATSVWRESHEIWLLTTALGGGHYTFIHLSIVTSTSNKYYLKHEQQCFIRYNDDDDWILVESYNIKMFIFGVTVVLYFVKYASGNIDSLGSRKRTFQSAMLATDVVYRI